MEEKTIDVLAYLQEKGIYIKGRHGDEVNVPCFFHDEDSNKRGRLYINVGPDPSLAGLYKCHKCDERGNLVTLMRHFGDELHSTDDKSPRQSTLNEIHEAACEYYQRNLGLDHYRWLKDERGLTAETIKRHRLGWADGGLYDHLKGKGFYLKDMLATGLVTLGQRKDFPEPQAEDEFVLQSKGNPRDFLFDMITIPYIVSGNVVQIRGKHMAGKYKTPPHQKGRLYNSDITWNADEIILTEGEFDCYSGDTEILTDEGWVRFDEYDHGRVAQWSPDGRLEMVEPLAYVHKEVDRRLSIRSSQNGGVDFVVTPRHRMVGIDPATGEVVIHPAEEFRRRLLIPRVGSLDGEGVEFSDDEIRLLVAASADASIDVRIKDGAQYLRFGFTKDRKVERLSLILRVLGIDFSKSELSNGVTSICFRLPNYLHAFKEFPISWLTSLSSQQRELILDELIYWDGNSVKGRSYVEYSTSLTHNAEWVQTLAHTTGRSATIMERSNSHGEWKKVSISTKTATSWQTLMVEEAGAGEVFCVQVPSSMLLVRRGDSIAVSGNCMVAEQMGYKACGLPGAQSWQDSWIGYLDHARKVYIVFDNDKTGTEAAGKLKDKLGSTARIVNMPENDLPPGENDISLMFGKQRHPKSEFDSLIREVRSGLLLSVYDAYDEWSQVQNEDGFKLGIEELDFLLKPGIMPGSVMIPLAKTNTGKSNVDSEIVPTPSGFRRWGDLTVGDQVFGSDGKPTEVIGVYDRGVMDSYRVTFSDGTSVLTGLDHIWTVEYRYGKFRDWKRENLTTEHLLNEPLKVGSTREWKYIIPMVASIEYPEIDTPVDPYTLGALIANGSLTTGSVRLSSPDDGVVRRVRKAHVANLHASPEDACPRFGLPDLTSKIRDLGLDVHSRDKFIPEPYLLSSIDQRIALLQGLMDGDGGASGHHGRAVLYFTTSRRLAEDVVCLVNSLGGTAIPRWQDRGDKGVECSINIMLPEEVEPFSTPRKQRGDGRYNTVPRRAIVSVEREGQDEHRCIEVSAEDSLYCITRNYIVTHNTLALLNLFQTAVGANPDPKFLFCSLEQTRGEYFERARRIYAFNNPTIPLSEVDAATLEFWQNHIMLTDRNRMTKEDLAGAIDDYEYEMGEKPTFVAIDYLGYFARSSAGTSPYERMTNAIMDLKEVAKEKRVIVCAPGQFSRGVEFGVEPDLDKARESVTGDTRVHLADGRWERIDSLVGSTPDVVTMNKDYSITTKSTTQVFRRPEKRQVFRVTLEGGRSIKGTAEHPVWTGDGKFTHIEDLREGDLCGVAMGGAFGNGDCWNPCLMGAYLADGSGGVAIAKDSNYRGFYDYMINEGLTPYDRGNHFLYSLTGALGQGVRNFLYRNGLTNVKSPDRFVPSEVMMANKSHVAEFLRGLMSGDGHVMEGRGVRYDTSSERLAREVQHLLSRFGISGTLSHEPPGKGAFSETWMWRVSIRRFECLVSFNDEIGLIGEKGECLERHLLSCKDSSHRSDLFSSSLYDEIHEVRKTNSLGWAALSKTNNPKRTSLVRGRNIRRDKLQWMAEQVGSKRLRDLTLSPVEFMKIISIELLDEPEWVYDLSVVGGLHIFSGNGVIIHQSGAIEETADFAFGLWNEDTRKGVEPSDRKGVLNWRILKSRQGGKGHKVQMQFGYCTLAMLPAIHAHSRFLRDELEYSAQGETWQQAMMRHKTGHKGGIAPGPD